MKLAAAVFLAGLTFTVASILLVLRWLLRTEQWW